MDKYVLRWQCKDGNNVLKNNYLEGNKNYLLKEAEKLKNNRQVVLIALDGVKEIIKDTRADYILNNLD